MKILAFVITMMIIGTSFAQNCGLVEDDADVEGSATWNTLVGHLLDNPHDPYHWKKKKAKYYVNTISQSAPPDAATAIVDASNSWNNANWGSRNDFTFSYEGSTGTIAKKKTGKMSFRSKKRFWTSVGVNLVV